MGAQRPLFHCHGDWSEKVMGRELIPELHTHTHTHRYKYTQTQTHMHVHTFSIWNPESPGTHSQKVGRLRVETHAREQNIFLTSLPPNTVQHELQHFLWCCVRVNAIFPCSDFKARHAKQSFPRMFVAYDDPTTESTRNTYTNTPPPSLPRGCCP